MAANSRRPTIEETLAETYDRIVAREAAKAPEPDYRGLPMAEVMSRVYDLRHPLAAPRPWSAPTPGADAADASPVPTVETNWAAEHLRSRFPEPPATDYPRVSAEELGRFVPAPEPQHLAPGFDVGQLAAEIAQLRRIAAQAAMMAGRAAPGSLPIAPRELLGNLDTMLPRGRASGRGKRLPVRPGFPEPVLSDEPVF